MKPKNIDIDLLISTLEAHWPTSQAPVVTLLAGRGASPFAILVSTLLSLRTKDAVTLEAADRLLAVADTPEKMRRLSENRIAGLIYPVGFYVTKAARLKKICAELIERFDGQVPDSLEALLSLPGVGRKTANLVRIEGFNKEGMCVDTHVHRFSNRIGLVETQNPDQTEMALRKILPKKYWKRYNPLVVAFGQTVCLPVSPFCSRCPWSPYCPKINVNRSR